MGIDTFDMVIGGNMVIGLERKILGIHGYEKHLKQPHKTPKLILTFE
jgi:hypothetical protein